MVAKLSQKFLKKTALILIVFLVFSFTAYARIKLSEDEFLHLYYFDIGQGSATLLRLKDFEILIDSGPNGKILQKLSESMPWNDKTIEVVVLTHPHLDHLGGMDEILKEYEVKRVVMSDISYDSKSFETFKKLLSEEGSEINYATHPVQLKFSDNFSLETLFPNQSFYFKELKEVHDSMTVVRVVYNKNSFIFPGDLEVQNEKKLLNLNIDSDILLAGHHGSRTSSSLDFLKRVIPDYVVISSGKDNKYGHPHKEVLEVMEGLGLKVLRTDTLGDIEFTSDGNVLNLVTNP